MNGPKGGTPRLYGVRVRVLDELRGPHLTKGFKGLFWTMFDLLLGQLKYEYEYNRWKKNQLSKHILR